LQYAGLSRRSFLGSAGALAGLSLLGSPGAHAIPTNTVPPLISGALRQYNPAFATAEGVAGWKRELDDEQRIGFDILWLANFWPALRREVPSDPLGDLLDLCAERGIAVILDIGTSPQWYATLDVRAELETVGKHIETIRARYGDHPAFQAWYIPHEIYVAWDDFGDYINELFPALVERCRQAAPGKPVTISPFFILDEDKVFGDFRFAPPDEYGDYWEALIKRAGFDIVMLQDSGEHFSYVTNAQRRPFFQAMHRACDAAGARLWGNVETAEFDCPSIEEYIRRYGRVHHGSVEDAPWRAVPLPRLKEKLHLAAEFSERIVTWGYYEKGRPHLSPEAESWYAGYKSFYEANTRA